jgi:hypothetical protein
VGQTLDAQALTALQARVEHRFGEARAPSTWRGLANVANQFHDFDSRQALPAYRMLELDIRMIYWLEWKVVQGHLHNQSATTYSKRLAELFKKITGTASDNLKEYTAALRRTTNASAGAIPLTVPDLQFLLHSVRRWEDLFYQILLQWVTASRSDDMNRLTTRDLVLAKQEVPAPDPPYQNVALFTVTTTWRAGVKGSHLPYTDISHLPEPYWQGLRRYLASHPPGEHPFPLDAGEMSLVIRNTFEHTRHRPEYTSHSLKKGALMHLIGRGYLLSEVAYKAKHQSTELLRVYVGPEAWAYAHNAQPMASAMKETLALPN